MLGSNPSLPLWSLQGVLTGAILFPFGKGNSLPPSSIKWAEWAFLLKQMPVFVQRIVSWGVLVQCFPGGAGRLQAQPFHVWQPLPHLGLNQVKSIENGVLGIWFWTGISYVRLSCCPWWKKDTTWIIQPTTLKLWLLCCALFCLVYLIWTTSFLGDQSDQYSVKENSRKGHLPYCLPCTLLQPVHSWFKLAVSKS